jgi:hypothetical protein
MIRATGVIGRLCCVNRIGVRRVVEGRVVGCTSKVLSHGSIGFIFLEFVFLREIKTLYYLKLL